MAELKRRFSGHGLVNTLVMADWLASINLDAENWQARLFLCIDEEQTQIDSDDFETPLFTEIEKNQQTLSYADPLVINVAEVNEGLQRYTGDDGQSLLSQGDGNLSIRIGHDPVPLGSILEWEEEQADGSVSVVTWYVHRVRTLGTQKAAVIYELISAGDVDSALDKEPEEDLDEDLDEELTAGGEALDIDEPAVMNLEGY